MGLLRHRGGWTITLSFIVALMLTIIPLPSWAALVRPEWVLIVFIYWWIALPERIGVGIGWIMGLFLDVVRGTLLGQHALALTIVALITLKLHQRIRVFPLYQQALIVLLLLILQAMIIVWIRGITGSAPQIWIILLPTITSALLWPWLFIFMRFLRRRYRVA